MSKQAELVVGILLDAIADNVEIEYHSSEIDSMPHTTWMILAAGVQPTQYLAKGTGHTPEDAQRQAEEKVRILGARVVKVHDFRKQR